jgi:hypothetical protein
MNKGNIKLVASDSAPSRLLQKHSPARMTLATLITRRNLLEDKLRALSDAGARLQEAAHAERHATAALATLDAEETRAMATWSEASDGPMPAFNQTHREKLVAEIQAAAAQASAARKAAAENGATQQRERAALKALEPEFAIAIAEVISEIVDPLFADYDAANRALAAKAAKIQQAFLTITDLAHSVGGHTVVRPAFMTIEKLHEKMRAVSGRAPPDGENHAAAWSSLAARLRSDPLAELES